MDKAEIKDLAKDVATRFVHGSPIVDPKNAEMVEAALTAIYDQGWDERGEADETALLERDGVAVFLRDYIEAIRRLRKKGQGV